MIRLLLATAGVSPLIFFTKVTRNPYTIQGTILYTGLSLLALWAIFRAWRKGGSWLWSPPDLFLLLWAGVCTISWPRAFWLRHQYGFYTTAGSVWSWGLYFFLFLWINCLLAYWIGRFLASDERNQRRILSVCLWVMGIAGIYGLMQYRRLDPIWGREVNPYEIQRLISTFGNPNFISSFLVLAIPIGLAFAQHATTPLRRVGALMAGLIGLLCLICTMTRSSWLGLAAAAAVWAALLGRREALRRWKRQILWLAGAAAVYLLLPTPQVITQPDGRAVTRWPSLFQVALDRGASIFSVEKAAGAARQRFLIWSAAWDMIQERPFLGHGFGMFEIYYPYYQQKYLSVPEYAGYRTHANNAHNELLEQASQVGILGAGLFFGFLICLLRLGWQTTRRLSDWPAAAAAAITAGSIGMLVDNLLNVTLHFTIPAFFFWLHAGVLTRIARPRRVPLEISGGAVGAMARVGGGLLAVGLCLVIVYAWRLFIAEAYYFRGFSLAKSSRPDVPAAIRYLEKAHAWRRLEVNNNYELGNSYARMRGLQPERAEAWAAKAVWAYQEALEAHPGYDEIYFNLAAIYNGLRRFEEAEENYLRSLRIHPLNVETWLGLGNSRLARWQTQRAPEKLEGAIHAYREATKIAPKESKTWNNLGYGLALMGQEKGDPDLLKESLRTLEHAVSLDPSNPQSRRNLDNLRRALAGTRR